MNENEMRELVAFTIGYLNVDTYEGTHKTISKTIAAFKRNPHTTVGIEDRSLSWRERFGTTTVGVPASDPRRCQYPTCMSFAHTTADHDQWLSETDSCNQ